MSDSETALLNLFDSYWFEHGVFSAKPPLSTAESSSVPDPLRSEGGELFENLNLNPIGTKIMRRSTSDQFLSSKDRPDTPDFPSPDSVLTPILQTVLSGVEVDDEVFQESTTSRKEAQGAAKNRSRNYLRASSEGRERRRGRSVEERRKKRSGKSSSELEFEEVKGFMDLGFVFSDEDKDSKLVSIIPGLQRLGKTTAEENGSIEVSRPYLSEAWGVLEDERRWNYPPLMPMDWRVTSSGSEMEVKDRLRFWAHAVASSVR